VTTLTQRYAFAGKVRERDAITSYSKLMALPPTQSGFPEYGDAKPTPQAGVAGVGDASAVD